MYISSTRMRYLPGCITGHRLYNRVPGYITRYLDAQLVFLSHPVMQPAKLPSCLTINKVMLLEIAYILISKLYCHF